MKNKIKERLEYLNFELNKLKKQKIDPYNLDEVEEKKNNILEYETRINELEILFDN